MKISLRIWILIIALLFSLLALKPSFESGVLVTSIDINSTFYKEGLKTGDIIKSINGNQIENIDDYADVITTLALGKEEKRIDIITKDNSYVFFTNETIGITVSNVPSSKIQTGLDLRGGARALVQPDEEISDSALNDLVEVARNRFNVYGLSDVNVKGITDLSGNKYLLIEIAGATPNDLEQLIAQQGKFEAKIANQTVFEGGKEKDIRDVCRNDATCSAVPTTGRSASPRAWLSSPMSATASPAPPSTASEWASAAPRRAGRCARATARRARSATRRAAARGC